MEIGNSYKLSGKCQDKFREWMHRNLLTMQDVYGDVIHNAFLVEFFDWVNMPICISTEMSGERFVYTVAILKERNHLFIVDSGMDKEDGFFMDRQSALDVAIKKANELYNDIY